MMQRWTGSVLWVIALLSVTAAAAWAAEDSQWIVTGGIQVRQMNVRFRSQPQQLPNWHSFVNTPSRTGSTDIFDGRVNGRVDYEDGSVSYNPYGADPIGLAKSGRFFVNLSGGYSWVEPVDVGTATSTAEIDASSPSGGLEFGVRLP